LRQVEKVDVKKDCFFIKPQDVHRHKEYSSTVWNS